MINCIICGKVIEKPRPRQKTCGCRECINAHKRLEYEANKDIYRMQRRNRERAKAERFRNPNGSIVGEGYAARQIENTLKMVGKVDVNL
jgi:hypothetical protein